MEHFGVCSVSCGKYWRISGGVVENYTVVIVFRIGINNLSELLGKFVPKA